MTIIKRPYQLGTTAERQDDYLKVRDFLAKTYAVNGPGLAWTIERWNFAHSLARIINDTSESQWANEIALWTSGEDLVAMVSSEGERNGEVHFHRASATLPEGILEEMFDFAEAQLGWRKDGSRLWQLRIRQGDQALEKIAAQRGYERQAYHEALSQVILTEVIETQLPQGFYLATGDTVSAAEKAQAHSLSFGYADRSDVVELSAKGYAQMALEPDYRPELDLYLKNAEGEILGFCCIWYDSNNQLGILEPVGTLEKVHGQGLGRVIVEAAMNKAFEMGARTFHVGTDKGFYLAIGFEKLYEVPLWEKRGDGSDC